MEVQYSPESVEDLQRIVEFVEYKNPYAARRIAIDIQEGVERIKQFPYIGLPVLKSAGWGKSSEKNPVKEIRDLYINHYTMRYLITSTVIYVLRGWHNKENEKNT